MDIPIYISRCARLDVKCSSLVSFFLVTSLKRGKNEREKKIRFRENTHVYVYIYTSDDSNAVSKQVRAITILKKRETSDVVAKVVEGDQRVKVRTKIIVTVNNYVYMYI